MKKRERLEKTIAGEAVDRPPVALWRHWPGDDQRTADLARSHIDFQYAYNWDFLRVMPSSNYSVRDYGVFDEWTGDVSGCREIIKHPVRRSLDWTELRTLDPTRGEIGKFLNSLDMIGKAYQQEDEVPILPTVYGPLAQASRIAGQELMLRNMRTHADRLRTGLNVITESTLRLIEALRRQPIAGIFYVIDYASYDLMSEAEYETFGVPYDRKILDSLSDKWWLNVVQVGGNSPMLSLVSDYPVQVFNWQDREARPDMSKARGMLNGTFCGGLGQWQDLHQGSPATIRDAARSIVQETEGKRLILGVGSTALITSPLSNIRAAREAVERIVV